MVSSRNWRWQQHVIVGRAPTGRLRWLFCCGGCVGVDGRWEPALLVSELIFRFGFRRGNLGRWVSGRIHGGSSIRGDRRSSYGRFLPAMCFGFSAVVGVLVWMAGGNRPYWLANRFPDLDSDVAILADGFPDEFRLAGLAVSGYGVHEPSRLPGPRALAISVASVRRDGYRQELGQIGGFGCAAGRRRPMNPRWFGAVTCGESK
ncbi:hypothetical protein CA85_31130 [Allorhodopirellula solitaria]|uniref:Uncharacterized protein n=1 Tax=Allorhodopirellula solitaria TaxID=2527987 RepID=A0A5C5XS48_9BACT|nr:hypothetical protein CA85_31130 [Allorhodopirellula solitaria]